MLVLSRKKNESIVIDGGIVIEILQIGREQIRIGVTAPAEVKVLRGELRPFSQQPSALSPENPVGRASEFILNGNRLQCVREPDLIFQTRSPVDPRAANSLIAKTLVNSAQVAGSNTADSQAKPRLVRCG